MKEDLLAHQASLLHAIEGLTEGQKERVESLLGEAQPKLTPLAGGLGCNDSESGGHCSFAEQAKVHDVLSEILDANQCPNYLPYADTLNESRIKASATCAYGNALQCLIDASEAKKQLVFEYFHARRPSHEAS